MIKCAICKNKFDTIRKFLSHIRKEHQITDKDYYDKYIHKTTDKCIICGEPTTFISFTKGYHKYCSHSCVNKSQNHINGVKFSKYIKYGDTGYNNPKKKEKIY